MGVFKYAKGLADKINGAKLHAVFKRKDEQLDPMQEYLTVGEYHVDGEQGTPNEQPYTLTVYQDENKILHQALSLESTDKLEPEYVRRFSPELQRYRAFVSRKNGRRYVVEEYLERFVARVKGHIRTGKNSVNVSVITDTHYAD